MKSKAIKKLTGYGIFLELDHCFFCFYFGMVLETHMKVGGRDSSGFFGKNVFATKIGKCAKTWQKIGFFEFIKECGS